MADTKISALTAATTPLAGTEVLPIVQSSTTKKVAVSDLTAGRSVSAASLSLTTTPLAVTSGGTGLATVAQGDLLYGSASNTLSALAKNTTATRYLANTGTSNNPAWAQIDLSNGVTGTLPTTNGGTGLTSFTANGVVYASSTSALTTGTGLQYSGSNVLSVNVTTPSTFSGSGVIGFQIGGIGNGLMGNSSNVWATQNVYFNSGYKKAATGYATLYNQSGGQHVFSVSNAGAGSAGDAITFTDFLTSQTNGDVTLNVGNLVIGTSGKGIDFSATPGTGTSELLADYEEGTWTPTVTGLTVVGTPTYTGRYTKIGRIVTFDLEISSTTSTSATYPTTTFTLPFDQGGAPRSVAVVSSGGAAQILTTYIYPPSWTTQQYVWISGSYSV